MIPNKIKENKKELNFIVPELILSSYVLKTEPIQKDVSDRRTPTLEDITVWEKPVEWFWEIISNTEPFAVPAPTVATHTDEVGLSAATRQNRRFGACCMRRNAFNVLQQAGHLWPGKEGVSLPAGDLAVPNSLKEQNHATN